jgi:hypothetical protein
MASESGQADVDVYSLGTIQSGHSVVASIRRPQSSQLNAIVEIQAADGTSISSNIARTRAKIEEDGTYYAVVSAWTGAGSRGQYVMDVNVQPTAGLNAAADLVVTEIVVPSTARGGQSVNVQWTVANNGDADATKLLWTDRVVLSANQVLGDADDVKTVFVDHVTAPDAGPALAAGKTYTAQAEVTLPFLDDAEQYWVFVTTDRYDAVDEQIFEGNNTAQSPEAIDVPAPMHVVDLIDVSPDPRNAPLDAFEVEFSEAIDPDTLTPAALKLHRDGVWVTVDADLTVTAVTETRYRVSGLASLTDIDGIYKLEVDAEEILIPAGVRGVGSVSDEWLMDSTPPASRVDTLPDYATSLSFGISVGGADIAATLGGTTSGLDYYELYVSVDLEPFTFWRSVSALDPQAAFQAHSSAIYSFRSIAYDLAGNREDEPIDVDAQIIVPDLSAPETNVVSVDVSSPTFKVDVQGTDEGTEIDFFELYVEIDGSVLHHFATISAGEPNATGVFEASIPYQAIIDGQTHSYRFYSIGQDIVGNREGIAGAESDVLVEANFVAQDVPEISHLDVQKGVTQRSYVRYLDVLFSGEGGLDELVQSVNDPVIGNERIRLRNLGLDGSSGGTSIDLEGVIQVLGRDLAFDFGSQGIGGDPNLPSGNGYYELGFDLNDDGEFTDDETVNFYRLLGDTNRDRVVDFSDYMAVMSAYGAQGSNNADLNGDGRVDYSDLWHVYLQLNTAIPGTLEIDD